MKQNALRFILPPWLLNKHSSLYFETIAAAWGYSVSADPNSVVTLVGSELAPGHDAAGQTDTWSAAWARMSSSDADQPVRSAGGALSFAEPDIFKDIGLTVLPPPIAGWQTSAPSPVADLTAALTVNRDQFVLTGNKFTTSSPQPETLSSTSLRGNASKEWPVGPTTDPAPAPTQAQERPVKPTTNPTPAPIQVEPAPVPTDSSTQAAPGTTTVPVKVESVPAPAPYSLKISKAADFIHSLGVNTHLGNPSYDDVELVLDQLTYIGVNRIRDWFPEQIWPLQYSQISTLASAGVKLNALLPNINPVDLDAHMAALKAFARANPGAVTSVEGPNEIDASPVSYRGLEGIKAVQILQKDLYAAVHGSSDLAGVPVYNFTTGWLPQSTYGIGDMSAYADYANVHGYVPKGLRPADWLPQTIQNFASNVPGKPIVVTETNYYTLPQHSDWGGVNQDVQATYGLYTALANWNMGISATFFYELRDQGSDFEREKNFGLFQADGSPKTFATALHNLTTILADSQPGAISCDMKPLTISFAGLPSSASAQLFQKSDGTSDLVVWDEQQIWDHDNHIQLAATASDVTVFLESSVSAVQLFDPLVGSTPVTTYHDVNQITFELLDHPLVFHLI